MLHTYEQALENHRVSSFQPCADVMLQVGTLSQLMQQLLHYYINFSLLIHMHITVCWALTLTS